MGDCLTRQRDVAVRQLSDPTDVINTVDVFANLAKAR